MDRVDTELTQLNICDQLRANSSFMKIMATLFYYGNQFMNAGQLVVAVRALDLLPLRGETPKSTIQGIISTSRKAARDLRQPDPFRIEKDNSGRQAKYAISDVVLNGSTVPPIQEIPDEPIVLKPVEHASSYASAYQLGKRPRNLPKLNTPDALQKANRRRAKAQRIKRKNSGYGDSGSNGSDSDVDMEDSSDFLSANSSDDEPVSESVPEKDTIQGYSLVYAPPSSDSDYIDTINFEEYPIASYFAIAQQKGYSYPRFRSHEKIKIPKVHCEDKFRVADIKTQLDDTSGKVVGRLFLLADGHGGRGCSEFFVRKMPEAIRSLCARYHSGTLGDKNIQAQFEKDIKATVNAIDEEYLAIKRAQLRQQHTEDAHPQRNTSPPAKKEATTEGESLDKTAPTVDSTASETHRQEDTSSDTKSGENDTSPQEEVENDGCTLIMNLFFGPWLVNVNVGDSRTLLISAPDRSEGPVHQHDPETLLCGLDNDYKMDVVFASQDHKPYLEHLAREILENGGEFVDSVQDRVIKVDLDKLKEDGNRQTKRIALKNARIRPKGFHATDNIDDGLHGWAAQSAVRTTVNHPMAKARSRKDRVPSLNVARSCGDLDFKMDPNKKIISCEPDVTFIRISDDIPHHTSRTVLTSSLHKAKRRHFLFMSTDGMFDYMYEETPERQNRAVAKVLGPLIEEGEKTGRIMLMEEEAIQGGQTIDHTETATSPGGPPAQASDTSSAQAGASDAKAPTPPTASSGGENTASDSHLPRPLLFRDISEEQFKDRKVKERTLVGTARYFANREGVHGFFASTLQEYDDCTIVLIEI